MALKRITFLVSCISGMFITLIGCNQPKSHQSVQKQDSLFVDDSVTQAPYLFQLIPNWPPSIETIDTDTVVFEKELILQNERYHLKLVKYSLNDSGVVCNMYKRNGYKTDSVLRTHNYVQQIILSKGNITVFDQTFSKKENLRDIGGYEGMALYDVQYNFTLDSKLYFTATLVRLTNGYADEVKFSIFYETNKVGQLDLWLDGPRPYTDINIYSIFSEDEKGGFTSMSDQYRPSSNDVIPNLYTTDDETGEQKLNGDDTYFKLEGKYRKTFLDGMKLSEKDKLYIYNFATDALTTIAIKDLDVVAHLNTYADIHERPHYSGEYQIGFEINKKWLKDMSGGLIYVGQDHPFVRGQIKRIQWKRIKRTNFPAVPVSTLNAIRLKSYVAFDAYEYSTDGLYYFLQDFTVENQLEARRFLILNAKTKEPVFDLVYFDSEGSSPTSLEGHWTGALFKNKPPVLFGLENVSFGCPGFLFISKPFRYLELNCDNRH